MLEVVIFCGHPADSSGARAHDDALSRDAIAAPVYAFQERTVGNAGGGKNAVALRHVLQRVDALQILDAPPVGARDLVVIAEHQPALHLPADAPQGSGRQDALGSAAGADIDVDAGL